MRNGTGAPPLLLASLLSLAFFREKENDDTIVTVWAPATAASPAISSPVNTETISPAVISVFDSASNLSPGVDRSLSVSLSLCLCVGVRAREKQPSSC
jgi:hypothetical protein